MRALQAPIKHMRENGKTRGKTQLRPAQHQALCAVCKHPQTEEIEHQFMAGATRAKLAAEFGFSADSMNRHVSYFRLDLKRSADTEKALQIIIDRGLESNAVISDRATIAAIKELNRITGQRQKDRENQLDLGEAEKEAELEQLFAETEREMNLIG